MEEKTLLGELSTNSSEIWALQTLLLWDALGRQPCEALMGDTVRGDTVKRHSRIFLQDTLVTNILDMKHTWENLW